jgi:hypothetical protein
VSGLYVYALLEGPSAGWAGRGVRDEPLRLVDCEGIVVAVGEVDRAPAPDAEHVRRHDAVIRRLAAAAEAILPARFGTLVGDEPELEQALAARGAGLRRTLDLVRGREQMTLRVYAELPASEASRDAPAEGPEAVSVAAVAGAGARYLEARRARRGDLGSALAPLRERLGDLVHAERLESHAVAPLLASVYHLIPRAASGRYRALVAGAGPMLPVRLRASGPWAPYAFAEAPLR